MITGMRTHLPMVLLAIVLSGGAGIAWAAEDPELPPTPHTQTLAETYVRLVDTQLPQFGTAMLAAGPGPDWMAGKTIQDIATARAKQPPGRGRHARRNRRGIRRERRPPLREDRLRSRLHALLRPGPLLRRGDAGACRPRDHGGGGLPILPGRARPAPRGAGRHARRHGDGTLRPGRDGQPAGDDLRDRADGDPGAAAPERPADLRELGAVVGLE